MYKMGQISQEPYRKCEIEIIDKGRYFWINRRDLEVESDYDSWAQIFYKCDPEKQKYRHELTPNKNFNRAEDLSKTISLKEKLKAVEKYQKIF